VRVSVRRTKLSSCNKLGPLRTSILGPGAVFKRANINSMTDSFENIYHLQDMNETDVTMCLGSGRLTAGKRLCHFWYCGVFAFTRLGSHTWTRQTVSRRVFTTPSSTFETASQPQHMDSAFVALSSPHLLRNHTPSYTVPTRLLKACREWH
jgi:hypothetical protein